MDSPFSFWSGLKRVFGDVDSECLLPCASRIHTAPEGSLPAAVHRIGLRKSGWLQGIRFLQCVHDIALRSIRRVPCSMVCKGLRRWLNLARADGHKTCGIQRDISTQVSTETHYIWGLRGHQALAVACLPGARGSRACFDAGFNAMPARAESRSWLHACRAARFPAAGRAARRFRHRARPARGTAPVSLDPARLRGNTDPASAALERAAPTQTRRPDPACGPAPRARARPHPSLRTDAPIRSAAG